VEFVESVGFVEFFEIIGFQWRQLEIHRDTIETVGDSWRYNGDAYEIQMSKPK
jgi:hypothetical protein